MRFLKKYAFTLFALANYFILFWILDKNHTIAVNDSAHILIPFMTLILLRLSDDFYDYETDLIRNRTLYSKRIIIIFSSLLIVAIIFLSIFFELYLAIPIVFLIMIITVNFFTKKLKFIFFKILLFPAFLFINIYFIYSTNGFLNIDQIIYLIVATSVYVPFSIFRIKHIVNKELNKQKPLEHVGGKAYNLYQVDGVRVPKFITLETKFFDAFINEHNIKSSLTGNREQIKSAIKSMRFIRRKKLYAVRSSGIDEDSLQNSFAGVMDSYLNVGYEEIADKVIEVYLSAYSERAISYRKENNIVGKIKTAVIIQEMISPEYSGVINTINPITDNPDETLISIVAGLGESLVSGKTDSFDFLLNSGKIVYRETDLIPDREILKIYCFSNIIQRFFDYYQDIEFAYKNKKIYLLQTRPVSAYSEIKLSERIKTLDNSNIMESFYGVVTPLTISFAKEIYEKVYTESLREGHISKRLLKRLSPYLKEMITEYDSRIYYNLNSWYKLVSIFPNSKENTVNMERMMGISSSIKNKKTKMNIIDLSIFSVTFLYRLKKNKKDSTEYLKRFKEITFPYVNNTFDDFTEEMLTDTFDNVQKQTLKDYVIPIINDTKTMIYYGKLTRFIDKTGISDKQNTISYLLSDQKDVISAKATDLFNKITLNILNNKEIKKDYLNLPVSELTHKYQNDDDIMEYIMHFGSRVTNELKLETRTITNNYDILFQRLKNYVTSDIKTSVHDKPEDMHIPLPYKEKRKLDKILHKLKYHIRNREELRITRTYMFQAVRNIFLRFSKIFYEQKIIKEKEDIFYLTKPEIFNIKAMPREEIRSIITERKIKYQEDSSKETHNRIIMFKNRTLFVKNTPLKKEGLLTGIPSNAGTVTGEIQYIDDINDIRHPGKIVLSERTDPGWITIFPVIKGMIVENGSVLSHSAVVSREMKIPAVIGVKNACKILRNGDIVTLDSDKGEIIIHEQKV